MIKELKNLYYSSIIIFVVFNIENNNSKMSFHFIGSKYFKYVILNNLKLK